MERSTYASSQTTNASLLARKTFREIASSTQSKLRALVDFLYGLLLCPMAEAARCRRLGHEGDITTRSKNGPFSVTSTRN